MKRRTGWFLVAGVAAVALGAATVGAVALLMRGSATPTWSGRTYLSLGLNGDIPENPAPDLGSVFGPRQLSMRVLIDSLDRAAGDPDVAGVLLRVGLLQTGWGKLAEVRDALVRFRSSGKPVYAHLEFCGNREYYLASAATRIYAVPTAIVNVTGLSAEVTFLGEALDKLGIEAQFEGVGKYKNAPNQYTETGFTPPHREQMDSILDALFEHYLDAIAEGRGKTREQVEAIVDAGPYDGAGALEAGLVDELAYRDQIEASLETSQRVGPVRYVGSERGFHFDGRPELALVFAVGEIVGGDSVQGPFGETYAGSDTIAAALRRAREDDDIRAIVLRVDSPGGSGTASDVIWREVKLARQTKPVVVSMGDLAASGGYYISMDATAIVAEPGTLTGSIGVFGGKLALEGLYRKLGLNTEILTRGEHADLLSSYRPWDDEERRRFRSLMEAFYADFVGKAAEGRGMTRDALEAIAQGRVWTGSQALELGLVDELGGLDEALSRAKREAGIADDQEVLLTVLPEPRSFWETLFERPEAGLARAWLPADADLAVRLARVLAEGAAARLPFDVRVR